MFAFLNLIYENYSFCVLTSSSCVVTQVSCFSQANDMKEARVDETLEIMGDQMLVYIPPQAMDGLDWFKKNQDYCQQISRELQTRSQAAEEAVIELINKFVEAMEDPSIDQIEKFNWFDFNKLGKAVFVIKPRGQGNEDDGM